MAIGSNPCGCPEGIGTCAEAWNCMQTHICPGRGIEIDGGGDCFGVALGSCMGFDGQGRVAWICGEEPEPGPCQVTIETLLEDGFFVGGRNGGTGNLTGWGSPQGIQYAIANNIRYIQTHAWATFDDQLTWAPARRGYDMGIYSTSPVQNAYDRTSAEWVAATSDPGGPDNYTGRYKQAPSSSTSIADGGYLGYGMPHFPLMLAVEGLKQVDGRAVVNLDMGSDPDLGVRQKDIDAAIRAIGQACAQAWTMVMVRPQNMSQVADLVAANITGAVAIDTQTDTFTPQQVIDSGATWVRISDRLDDATITEWVDSGLNVVVWTNSRQIETERIQALGAVGIVCDDPQYASDDFPEFGYQSFAARGPTMGVLDYHSDQNQIRISRGYTRNGTNGLWIHNSPAVNDTIPPTEATVAWNVKLLGMLRSVQDPAPPATINLNMRFDWTTQPANSSAQGGLIVAANQDVDMSGVSTGYYDNRYPPLRSGYLCTISVGTVFPGRLRIFRIDGDDAPELIESATGATVSQGSWASYTLTITETGLTWGKDSAALEVSVEDASYRGPYLYAATINSRGNPDTWQTGFSVDPDPLLLVEP